MVRAHAHNDYRHDNPLHDALDKRFHSVEADVWLEGEIVQVSHDPGRNSRGSLEDLYVTPLARRIDQYGSVHGNGETFFLWIDLKEDSRELRDAVHAILARYPEVFTRYSDKTIEQAPVDVIFTGGGDSKVRYTLEHQIRLATHDGGYLPDAPPVDHRWRWCALHWPGAVGWNGEGEISPDQLEQMRTIVRGVHGQGRRLRFWATPETEAFWRLACDEGLDLINTDKIEELCDFLVHQGSITEREATSSR